MFKIKHLENLILMYDAESIYTDTEGYHITTEWLVGGFCGVEFCSPIKCKAIKDMCDYFRQNINHESLVGHIVTNSGWPDLKKVEEYLFFQNLNNVK